MKRLLFAMLLQGCVAGVNTAKPVDYCDVSAVDWGDPECTVVEAQGAFSPDYRYVCPQADGTEWELRVAHTEAGDDAKVYQRYKTSGGHIIDSMLCIVALDGTIVTRGE